MQYHLFVAVLFLNIAICLYGSDEGLHIHNTLPHPTPPHIIPINSRERILPQKRRIPTMISEDDNLPFLQPATLDEVHKVMKSLGALKSPGADGLPGLFYRKHWQLIGADLLEVVNRFLQTGTFSSTLNQTHLCLVPKRTNPSNVAHYRPISLCNYAYKIILKFLVMRMRPLMGKIVCANQSAFVPGRVIHIILLWLKKLSIISDVKDDNSRKMVDSLH